MKIYIVFQNYGLGPESIRDIFSNEDEAKKCVIKYPQSSIEMHEVLDKFKEISFSEEIKIYYGEK